MSGAAEAAFRKWYRTQSVAAVLCTGFLVVEKPVAMGPAAELGVLALAFLMKPLVERFHDTKLMVGGVFVMIASCFLMVNYNSSGEDGTITTAPLPQYYAAILR